MTDRENNQDRKPRMRRSRFWQKDNEIEFKLSQRLPKGLFHRQYGFGS